MGQVNHIPTTNKLFSSRIIKFALIGIIGLLLIKAGNLALYMWVTDLIVSGAFEEASVSEVVLLRILGIIDIGVAGGITTIVTAVIARYGLRESTGNLGIRSQEKSLETQGKEE